MSKDRVGMAYVMLEDFAEDGFMEGDIARIIVDDGSDFPLVCSDRTFKKHIGMTYQERLESLGAFYMQRYSKAGPMPYENAKVYAYGLNNPEEPPTVDAIEHLLENEEVDSVVILFKDGSSEWHSN